MRPTFPLPLHHSWPLAEHRQRFDLGIVHDGCGPAIGEAETGRWRCDLVDSALSWSDAVFDLFGLPRGASVSRAETVALYADRSRAAMEQLRAHAIKHHRGFTLDAEIVTTGGANRWMRLIAVPVCVDGRVVALQGLKQDATSVYR